MSEHAFIARAQHSAPALTPFPFILLHARLLSRRSVCPQTSISRRYAFLPRSRRLFADLALLRADECPRLPLFHAYIKLDKQTEDERWTAGVASYVVASDGDIRRGRSADGARMRVRTDKKGEGALRGSSSSSRRSTSMRWLNRRT